MTIPNFGDVVVAWQKQHGRHDLPWQETRDPYAVWLSEIMLQQTQVSTVRDYFARFMQRFPTVTDLALAHVDEVLAMWSGLGYYTRARNLHRAAQQVLAQHGGQFPTTAAQLQTLPGIGRSTAAAVASICFGEAVAILDGNVKRVLTRYLGFDEDLSASRHEKTLWTKAQTLLPQHQVVRAMPSYTQGVMDLGATVCTPKKPRCEACPVCAHCVAHAAGDPERYPVKTRKLKRSVEQIWLLYAQTQEGDVWLVKRPHRGVWAGLYCLPVFDSEQALQSAIAHPVLELEAMPVVKHVLTHKDLYLHPMRWRLEKRQQLGAGQWLTRRDCLALGLPAPIRQMLEASG